MVLIYMTVRVRYLSMYRGPRGSIACLEVRGVSSAVAVNAVGDLWSGGRCDGSGESERARDVALTTRSLSSRA